MEKEEIIQEARTKSQEARDKGEDGSVAGEESTDIIYDIADDNIADDSESSKNSDDSESPDTSTPTESADLPDPAKTEIDKMISEIGADTLLQIIKGNRNAAIEQIIKEVEASHDRSLPSGASSAPTCTSIFDLAAMA
ncbi:MAG: hypothetical protein K2L17_01245 [Muribaculaceae bacterium]|nr:hypothetical protein [Muribaculaceae bacterium]